MQTPIWHYWYVLILWLSYNFGIGGLGSFSSAKSFPPLTILLFAVYLMFVHLAFTHSLKHNNPLVDLKFSGYFFHVHILFFPCMHEITLFSNFSCSTDNLRGLVKM